MTSYFNEQLDRACRKINECQAAGAKLPAYLAEKYNVTVQEIINRCQELKAT